jgi:ornithine decarboxylase
MTNDDPFYIADVSHCAKQYVTWKYYLPNIKPFYSVKTNGNHFIIRIIEKMGGGFSCSSIAELDAVLSICPDIDCSKRIIYSHPCKPDSHIKYFKDRNVELTVADNENELIKLNTHWPNAKILIRLKVNDDNSSVLLSSQFGANERVINQLFEKAKSLRLELIGCAFHVGTGCCDKYTFKRSLQFAKQVFDISKKSKYAFNFKILDIGGGFPGVDEDGKPSFLETTTVINEAINEFFPDHQDMNIIAEPGRYFAAACMDLVTSIIASRFNNEDYLDHESSEQDRSLTMNKAEQTKNVYYINDGIYGSLPSILYKNATYCVSSLREKNPHSVKYEEKKYRSVVFGPTCDSSDCLSMSVDLPRLDIGDHLLIYNVGAYSTTCAAKFNGFQTNKYFYIWKD